MLYLINKNTKEHKVLTADAMWSHNDWHVALADPDGWIAHDRGECPLPNESRCDLKMKGFDSDYKSVQIKGLCFDVPVAMRRAITHYRPILTETAPVYTTPQPVVDADAKREAESLAMALWRKWYKDESPDFELCDSVAGVITQINNMTTGLVREQAPQPVVPDETMVAALCEIAKWIENSIGHKNHPVSFIARKALLSAGKGGDA